MAKVVNRISLPYMSNCVTAYMHMLVIFHKDGEVCEVIVDQSLDIDTVN
jgi:hypothetical protein